jgi:hypothetical protein
MDARFRIGPSKMRGAGLGVLAVVPIREGELVEVLGVPMARGSEEDICTAYGDAYKIEHGLLLILPTGYAGMMNDSDTPNMKKCVKAGTLFLRAVRDIEAGEELTIRYAARGRKRYRKEKPRSARTDQERKLRT